jgi:hypothetical protein
MSAPVSLPAGVPPLPAGATPAQQAQYRMAVPTATVDTAGPSTDVATTEAWTPVPPSFGDYHSGGSAFGSFIPTSAFSFGDSASMTCYYAGADDASGRGEVLYRREVPGGGADVASYDAPDGIGSLRITGFAGTVIHMRTADGSDVDFDYSHHSFTVAQRVRSSSRELAAAVPPVVAKLHGVAVRAPAAADAWGRCPARAERLDAAGLTAAKDATLLALPTVAQRARPPLQVRGAYVIGLRHTHRNGDVLPSARACQGTRFLRSALVQIVLPAEKDADLRGNLWFYVARTPNAWVIWDEAH